MTPQSFNRPTITGSDFGTLPLPVVLYADGSVLTLATAGDYPTLEELQKAVGGYIEFVPVPAMKDIVMVADEEGLLKRKTLNRHASDIAMRPIVGDVVLLFEQEMEEREEEE